MNDSVSKEEILIALKNAVEEVHLALKGKNKLKNAHQLLNEIDKKEEK